MRYAALVVVLLLLGTACSVTHAAPPSSSSSSSETLGLQVFPVAQRTRVPELAGETIAGTRFDLASLAGHGPVAINVWASWCGPCRQELPLLVGAAGRHLHVVGLDERDHSSSALAFARSRGASYPSLSDPDGRLLARLRMLPQAGIPSTLFLDRLGRVAARVIGPIDRPVLRRVVRLLGGS